MAIMASLMMLLTPYGVAQSGEIDPQPTSGDFAFNGSVGIVSDYFWRGASQTEGQMAKQFTAEISSNNFYVGTFVSDVEFAGMDSVDLEYDFYAGYQLDITDQLSFDAGVIQYRYDSMLDSIEEWYILGSYGPVSVGHYINNDDSDMSYSEIEISVPFIDVVDMSVRYGSFNGDGSYVQVNASRAITDNLDMTLELVDLNKARKASDFDKNLEDYIALGLVYNF